MASTARKRTRGASGSQKQAKSSLPDVKWEWQGDTNWKAYDSDVSDKVTEAMCNGEDSVVVQVGPGVKMKIRFSEMAQMNLTSGWQRDVRCIPSKGSHAFQSWEWEESLLEWKQFAEQTNRYLEAAQLCGLKSVKVSLGRKAFNLDLTKQEMASARGDTYKVRRATPPLGMGAGVWQWQDENGLWKDYLSNDSVKLESTHLAGKDSVSLLICGRSYTVSLSKMEQKNDASGVIRKVKRITIIPAASKSTVAAQESKRDPVAQAAPTDVGKKAKGRSQSSRETAGGSKASLKSRSSSAASAGASLSSSSSSSSSPAPGSDGADVKTQVFSGKAPVDSECRQKILKAHVYCEGGDTWSCTLNQTNLRNNNNKFYIIQLLEENARRSYSVWFRWGRVGKSGQNNLLEFGSNLDSAKSTFTKKFSDKTHNEWEDRHTFVKVPGKYDLLEMDYKAKEETDAGAGSQETVDGDEEEEVKSKPVPVSKLHPKLQDLILLICNVQAMEDIVKEMSYDTRKAPLGKLTTSQIKLGYAALKKIETLIRAKKTTGDKLLQACDEFYTRIPHDFGMRRPPVINTMAIVKEKMDLLESLGDIQIAMNVLKSREHMDEHPIDRHYLGLNCKLDYIDPEDGVFKMVEKYVRQTHGWTHKQYQLQVEDLFVVDRDGESEAFKDVGNRQLLWHGSRMTNWVGILSQGLRIAPPEAPMTGYMFGKGVYFADCSSKSANYCFSTRRNTTGLMLLSEVALGRPHELLSADYNAHNLPKGKHSVKGLGKMAPDPSKSSTMSDGCSVPLGPIVDTGVSNPGGYTLNYNEFVVYDRAQIKMRYLVKLSFNFT